MHTQTLDLAEVVQIMTILAKQENRQFSVIRSSRFYSATKNQIRVCLHRHTNRFNGEVHWSCTVDNFDVDAEAAINYMKNEFWF
jgi:hypothetical protein